MNGRLPRTIVLLLFAAVLGLPFVPAFLRQGSGSPVAAADTLVVLTPHNEQIRHEITIAFTRWHESNFGRPVAIDWRSGSGTSDIERILVSGYSALIKDHRADDGLGFDVLFGGGDYFFGKMKKGVAGQSLLEPLDLGEPLLREVYPQPTIADKPLHDPQGYWFGVVLSSFGIIYNEHAIRDLGLPAPPQTWSDLNDARYFGRLALADPTHSGSVRVTYEAIVQRYGWERGWATIRRTCANSQTFAVSSTRVPIDVSSGDAAAGMCIDFYGRNQAQVIGAERVQYVAPADATVVTADPVAALRGTKKKELAARFVRFLLSVEGQSVWAYRKGEPGGPRDFELRRPPIRRDMYRPEHLVHMADRVNLFDVAQPLPPATPGYFGVIPTVMRAMAMDIHDDLRAAWHAIIHERDAHRRDAMLKLFDALPFTPDELRDAEKRWKSDPAAQTEDRLKWTAFFRKNYRQIIQMERENP